MGGILKSLCKNTSTVFCVFWKLKLPSLHLWQSGGLVLRSKRCLSDPQALSLSLQMCFLSLWGRYDLVLLILHRSQKYFFFLYSVWLFKDISSEKISFQWLSILKADRCGDRTYLGGSAFFCVPYAMSPLFCYLLLMIKDIQYQSGYIIHIATGIFDHIYDYEQMEATLDISKCKKTKNFNSIGKKPFYFLFVYSLDRYPLMIPYIH